MFVPSLHSNSIKAEDAISIAKALENNVVLTSLDVGNNGLTEEAALSLVQLEMQRNKLTSLGLACCNISASGAKEIAEYISVSRVLTTLDLCENELTNVWPIAEALEVNQVLTSLRYALAFLAP